MATSGFELDVFRDFLHDFDISGLKPCAYILWMSTTVGLTEGWGLISDATDSDHIAFCVR